MKTETENLIETESHPIQFDYASKTKRFLNALLDQFFLQIVTFMFAIGLGITLAIVSPSMFESFTESGMFMDYLIGFVLAFIYYTLQEMFTGRTLGKVITQTKVVMIDGTKPTPKKILVRTLCRFIPFEFLSFLGSSPQG
jgi:uncharacterized RDD family membrane protein YckC